MVRGKDETGPWLKENMAPERVWAFLLFFLVVLERKRIFLL